MDGWSLECCKLECGMVVEWICCEVHVVLGFFPLLWKNQHDGVVGDELEGSLGVDGFV